MHICVCHLFEVFKSMVSSLFTEICSHNHWFEFDNKGNLGWEGKLQAHFT